VTPSALSAELADGRDLGQVPELTGFRPGRLLDDVRADLDGSVAVLGLGAQAGHGVRLGRDDRDGHHGAVILEDLGHADLAADQADISA
jgi:hypothetical protein